VQLCVLCVSVVCLARKSLTTETQRTQRLHRAKSANEQQEPPSMKSCYSKTEIVIFRTIQQQRTLKFFHQLDFVYVI
jgi:hypothetical protein